MKVKNPATFLSEDIEAIVLGGLELLHDGHEDENEVLLLFE